jgi:hypothetical protein
MGPLTELYRQILEAIDARIEAALRHIDPALVSGTIPAGALPRGTVIDRGTYSPLARYRAGDLVVDGGTTYIALVGSTGVATSDTGTWRPIGGIAVPPPPDTYVYLIDSDGAYLLDTDGGYLYEAA